MRMLVTGGAGFIGSNLVDALIARGDAVTIVDDLSTGRRENLVGALAAGARLERLSVVDGPALEQLVADVRPAAIFHLAAQIDVRASVADPAHDARVNVEGTVNVLEAARRAGVGRVVLSSTGGAIYGEAEQLPTAEDAELKPLSPYGQAKCAGEGYAGLYASLYGLSTIALRYANVYGPRQDPLGEGGVVAIFCGKFAAAARPTVFGDGEQTRDYVHVDDVVRANVLAAAASTTEPINVGTGIETSVLGLVEAFRAIGDERFEPLFEPPRLGEVKRSCLAIERARSQLAWEPRIELADGIRDTLEQLTARSSPATSP